MSEAAPLPPEEVARLREAFSRIPYARLLGLELEEVARGAAAVSVESRAELERFSGIMHGGAIASVVDTASAFAVLSLLEPGEQTVTVDLTLQYLRPVSGGRLKARGRVLRAGRRLVSVCVEVTNESGALVSAALTTYARTN